MSAGKQFNISVRWNKKRRTYLAAATNLRGVVGQGKTREEALASCAEAIHWFLASPPDGPAPQHQQSHQRPLFQDADPQQKVSGS
jgi:predicted RNase H-like HicB family nuclease